MSRSFREWVEANDPDCPLPPPPKPLFSVNATALLSIWLRQGARRGSHLQRSLWHFFRLPAVPTWHRGEVLEVIPTEDRVLYNP